MWLLFVIHYFCKNLIPALDDLSLNNLPIEPDRAYKYVCVDGAKGIVLDFV